MIRTNSNQHSEIHRISLDLCCPTTNIHTITFQYNVITYNVLVKVKAVPYSITVYGLEHCRSLGNQPIGDLVIITAVGCHCLSSGQQYLPFQPDSITALWQVSNLILLYLIAKSAHVIGPNHVTCWSKKLTSDLLVTIEVFPVLGFGSFVMIGQITNLSLIHI